MSIYECRVTSDLGEVYTLDRYKGKVMLIVNTATKCGLVGQFAALQSLYEKYADQGFVVLGFPSNQFKQEVATADQAAQACRLTYGVTFPMHEIIAVNGEHAHPLFKLLTSEQKGILNAKIKWNFTKFLVDREGQVVARFGPTENPAKMEKVIERYI